jgi:hypothetical protein
MNGGWVVIAGLRSKWSVGWSRLAAIIFGGGRKPWENQPVEIPFSNGQSVGKTN